MTHVGENIKRIRTAKKMTITDVANEHVSRGMISLIENGKTQPSIERLQHIARQLNVDISELVETVPREEMQRILKEAIDLFNEVGNKSVVKVAALLKPILNKDPAGYEAARMNELYGRALYHLYIVDIDQYNNIEENNWEVFTKKAIGMYNDLQMEWRVVRCYGLLADIEANRGNYQSAIDIIEQATSRLTVMDSLETRSIYIQLESLRAFALDSLGQRHLAHEYLDDVIEFARENIILNQYYHLLNAKAWFYYDDQKPEQARKYIEECYLFTKLLKNESLTLQHEMNQIFIQEFFEKDYEKALTIAKGMEKRAEKITDFPKETINEFIMMTNDLEARVLTKLGRYEEALVLFEENRVELNERNLGPTDVATRVLSKSYEALCYLHMGDQEKAEELARYTVDKLHNLPHSSFYHFAREVLTKVMSK